MTTNHQFKDQRNDFIQSPLKSLCIQKWRIDKKDRQEIVHNDIRLVQHSWNTDLVCSPCYHEGPSGRISVNNGREKGVVRRPVVALGECWWERWTYGSAFSSSAVRNSTVRPLVVGSDAREAHGGVKERSHESARNIALRTRMSQLALARSQYLEDVEYDTLAEADLCE